MTTIQSAGSGQVQAISELIELGLREFLAPDLGPGGLERLLEVLGPVATKGRLDQQWPTFVASDNSDLVGVLMVRPPTHLFNLFLARDWQRRGIGSALVQFADHQVQQVQGARLQTVNASPNAVGFYQRLDFQIDGPLVDDHGVRFQPMSRRSPVSHAGLEK